MGAAYNPRRISRHDYDQLRWSIATFGYVQLVVVNKRSRSQGWPPRSRPTVVGGHQGIRASHDEDIVELPIHWVDVDSVLEHKLNLILNRTGGEFVHDQVEAILRELREEGDGLEHIGFTDDEIEAFLSGRSTARDIETDIARQTLRERFIVPPFSVLDARQGYWRERKAAWLALGIQSELGRNSLIPGSTVDGARGGTATAPRAAGNYVTGRKKFRPALHHDHRGGSNEYASRRLPFRAALAHGRNSAIEGIGPTGRAGADSGDGAGGLLFKSDSGRDPAFYQQKRETEKRLGRKLSTAEFLAEHYVPNDGSSGLSVSGTSVFDPVLCELVVRWFSPPGGRVLDPFAGGSVRGIVAGLLGRDYLGVDLSSRQVEANELQAARIVAPAIAKAPPAEELAVVTNPGALTPIQRVGDIWLKRDDLLELGGVRGGKVRTCWALSEGAGEGLVTAGSRASPQVNIVARIAAERGLRARAHVPAGPTTPELEAAVDAGAELVKHPAGRNSVIVARARADAKASGWTEIPFGMECEEAVTQTRQQVKRIPRGAKRIVVAVGSGMTLAGILHGLADAKRQIPVLGVRVGADPTKRLDRYAPEGWRERVELVRGSGDYHDAAPELERWGILFDAHYEAKVLPFLEPGDLFWVVGIRQSAVARAGEAAARWKISAKWAAKHVDCSVESINRVCGAGCCKGEVFWPPMSGARAPDGCDHLGPEGCVLPERDKPVTCLLYPFMLNPSGTVVLHNRLPTKTAPCRENYGCGPPVVEAIQGNLATLFGHREAERIVAEVAAGRDVEVPVSAAVVQAVEREHRWAEDNVPPQPRSGFAVEAPAVRELPRIPEWRVGDARELDAVGAGQFDLIFTCPPYFDLERYSDDPADLSAAESYEKFLEALRTVLARAAARLRDDRFAVLVVGEIRDRQSGACRGFVADTIRAAELAGLRFYNDAVLVTPAGSLPVRAARAFEASRKLGKTHQNVLVFVKGKPDLAAAAAGASQFGTAEEIPFDDLAAALEG